MPPSRQIYATWHTYTHTDEENTGARIKSAHGGYRSNFTTVVAITRLALFGHLVRDAVIVHPGALATSEYEFLYCRVSELLGGGEGGGDLGSKLAPLVSGQPLTIFLSHSEGTDGLVG